VRAKSKDCAGSATSSNGVSMIVASNALRNPLSHRSKLRRPVAVNVDGSACIVVNDRRKADHPPAPTGTRIEYLRNTGELVLPRNITGYSRRKLLYVTCATNADSERRI
jgi:hypothetical protein